MDPDYCLVLKPLHNASRFVDLAAREKSLLLPEALYVGSHRLETTDMPCHTRVRGRYRTAYRPRLTTILLCLVGLAWLPSALCRVGTDSLRRDPITQQAVPVAVGFHLGQSYA